MPSKRHANVVWGRVRADERGVTLIELLVAITIVSLLATTALFAWRAGVSGWEKASARLEHDRTVLAVHQVVSEQIAAMAPYDLLVERVGQVMFFQGEAETARFVSRYSLTHRTASGLYLVEYHVAEQRDGSRQLLLQETPIRSVEELAERLEAVETESGLRARFRPFERGPEAVVLLEGLDECRFEYYETPRGEFAGNWTSEWIGVANEIPTAMRIHAAGKKDSVDLEPVTITAMVRNFAKRESTQGIFGLLGR